MTKMTQEEKERIVRDEFANYPEAGTGMCLQPIVWLSGKQVDERAEFRYVFEDAETGKVHTVHLQDAIRGLDILIAEKLRGNLNGIDLPPNSDAYTVDAMAQCAIFGKVIYG